MKFRKTFLGTLTAGLLGATAAMAVPTVTIDGISVPIDSTSGGAVFSVQVDHEDLITTTGQTLMGDGVVSSIQDFPTLTTTYLQPCATVGCSGTFLTDVFNNLLVRAITPVFVNGVQTGNEIYLTGGTLTYYVQHTLPNLATGSLATDMANAASSTIFLSLQPAVFDSFGDTMSIFVPGPTLGDFTGVAQGNAFLNVVGGDAASVFNTNTFVVGNGFPNADLEFVGNANLVGGSDGPVGGSDDTFGNTVTAVPEPASLAILGAGLFLIGWSLRRRASQPRA